MGMLLSYHPGYSRESSEDQGQPAVPADESPKPGSKAELQGLAEAFGLDSSGTKAELQERLDAYQADAAAQFDADQPTEGGSDSE